MSVLTSSLEQVTALWDALSLLGQVLLNQETATSQTAAEASQTHCCPAQNLIAQQPGCTFGQEHSRYQLL